MRRGLAVPLLLAFVLAGGPGLAEGPAPADHGARTLVPPTNGTFLFGAFGAPLHGDDLDAGARVLAATHHDWDTNTTECHRRIYADLAWRPTSLTDDPNASVDVPYVFDLGLTWNGTTGYRRILEPRERIFLAELPEDDDLTVHLVLRQGAAVEWSLHAYAYRALFGCDGPILLGPDRTPP